MSTQTSFPAFPPTPGGDGDIGGTGSGTSASKTLLVLHSPPSVVETPTSPSSAFALSRFEFETGMGNEGTKILMIEWNSSAAAAAAAASATSATSAAASSEQRHGGSDGTGQPSPDGLANGATSSLHATATATDDDAWADWEVTWEGKTDTNAVAVRSTAGAGRENGTTLRVYFLLPPGQHIPPLVSIRRRGHRTVVGGDGGDAAVLWTKPMPAIFPASLGGSSSSRGRGGLRGGDVTAAGQRGVLHTIWAQQRLADLAAEIAAEMQANSESVGLQIAIQEHAWITEHFGVVDGCSSSSSSGENADAAAAATAAASTSSPSSPSSPSSSSLPPPPPTTATPALNPPNLSSPPDPQGSSSKLGEKLRGLRLATSPAELEAASRAKRATAGTTLWTHAHATQQRRAGPAHLSSLDAVVHGDRAMPADEVDVDGEDELFAMPLSPRSPDMIKSPFSVL